jgi:hypothetical protein
MPQLSDLSPHEQCIKSKSICETSFSPEQWKQSIMSAIVLTEKPIELRHGTLQDLICGGTVFDHQSVVLYQAAMLLKRTT